MSDAPKRLWAMCTASQNWDEPLATPFKVDHFEEYAHIDQLTALQVENARLRGALEPFAACADHLDGDQDVARTPDDEWAKFRLLASDYRRARAAREASK